MTQHKFGGHWTEAKLAVLKHYLGAFSTALKGKGFQLRYIDAFAGSGKFVPIRGDGQERLGSAQIALAVSGFHRYHFIEMKPRRCRALREMAEAAPEKGIEVHEGDANRHLADICRNTGWRGTRAVLFLDPYGMQVEWKTLETVARTGAIDVWYLFPLSGVTRQLALNQDKLDEDKRRSLDRVLGTPDWRDAFYAEVPTGDLFGAAPAVERHADSLVIEKWVTARLRTLFPLVEGPLVLRLGRHGKLDSGPPLFGLYFLAANKSPAAQRAAKSIATDILGRLRKQTGIR